MLSRRLGLLRQTCSPLSTALFVHRDTPGNSSSDIFEFKNKELCQRILAKYPPQYRKAAIMPLLDEAQRQLGGWTSLAAMKAVADLCQVPAMRVYEVATFYTMYRRTPRGLFFLQVCTTTPCQLCGAMDVYTAAKEAIGPMNGDTSADGLFTLVEVECAGACVNAPVMAINDDYYEDLSVERTKELISQLRELALKAKKEQGVADGILPPPIQLDPSVLPKPGPQRGDRQTCEPRAGLTSLKSPPPKPGDHVRADL